MNIGTKIRQLRLQKRMSQEELAYELGIAQTSVSNIESNKSTPDFLIMQNICEVFEVGFDTFLEYKVINKVKINKDNAVVYNNGTINNFPNGILESMLKRIEYLEEKLNNQ